MQSTPYYSDASVYCWHCAPKDAIPGYDTESDSPENCEICHRPLDVSLTPDGVDYTIEIARETLRVGRAKRNKAHKCYNGTYYEDSRDCEIVRDWVRPLRYYGGLSDHTEAFIDKFLSWTAR